MSYARQKKYRQRLQFKSARFEAQDRRRRKNLMLRPPAGGIPHRPELIEWFLNCPSAFAFPGMFEAIPGVVRIYLDRGPAAAAAAIEAFASIDNGPDTVLPHNTPEKDLQLIEAHRIAMKAEVEQMKALGMWESAA